MSAAGAEERRGRVSAAGAGERCGRATAAEAEKRRGRGLSSREEVAKKERETNEQHGGTVALVASPKERDDVESHQKQRCPEASVRRARSVEVTNYGDDVVEHQSPGKFLLRKRR